MQPTRLAKTTPTTEKIPATAPGLCRIPDSDITWSCWAFATIDVDVTNDPLLSVEVLQRVTSGGVVMNFEPFESVVVKPKGFDRVDAGCVVIVLVSGPVEAVAWTTVTEITVEKGCLRTEVSVAFVAVLAGVELVEEGKSALVETEGGGACGESLCGKAGGMLADADATPILGAVDIVCESTVDSIDIDGAGVDFTYSGLKSMLSTQMR
jgi:hypothetical protein